jgi:DNA-binding response OmpR family regulator
MKILVVEDEQKIADFLIEGLVEQNYTVDYAADGQKGAQLAIKNQYDVILLDVIIPVMNGVELCKLIKSNTPDTPVLMLTALGTTEDKLIGFDAGADDYLVKPFEFKELLARIKALTRRSQNSEQPKNMLKVADLILALDKKIAFRSEKMIALTAKEFSLLEFLMRNKGKVFSRLDIVEKVWDLNFDTGTNIVEVYVNILRKKVDKDFSNKFIHSLICLGYIMEERYWISEKNYRFDSF